MKLTTRQLRTFLQTRLNDTQLRTYVMDHFPELFGQVSAWGQSYTDRVLLLIDYGYRQGILDELGKSLAADFPEEMAYFRALDIQEEDPVDDDDRLAVPAPDSWDN